MNLSQLSSPPTIAVHKFSSCDGCQLAFLNAGPALLTLTEQVELVHFAEAGAVDPERLVDIAFVEGSISSNEEMERIRQVREHCRILVTIGACATSGGLQALRNLADVETWGAAIYPNPEYLDSLQHVSPIHELVKVDVELPGCPVTTGQVMAALNALLTGRRPRETRESVCASCKRQALSCLMVTRGLPCMGPVTAAGCGAVCPRTGRGCYGCYGPAHGANTAALSSQFRSMGLNQEAIARQYLGIQNHAEVFLAEALEWRDKDV